LAKSGNHICLSEKISKVPSSIYTNSIEALYFCEKTSYLVTVNKADFEVVHTNSLTKSAVHLMDRQ
jgi:hypothetical protein